MCCIAHSKQRTCLCLIYQARSTMNCYFKSTVATYRQGCCTCVSSWNYDSRSSWNYVDVKYFSLQFSYIYKYYLDFKNAKHTCTVFICKHLFYIDVVTVCPFVHCSVSLCSLVIKTNSFTWCLIWFWVRFKQFSEEELPLQLHLCRKKHCSTTCLLSGVSMSFKCLRGEVLWWVCTFKCML